MMSSTSPSASRKPFLVDTSSGTPTLQLETGSSDRYASYTSGSGSNTLTFQYTVQAGDNTTDLDQLSSTALELNGGSINDAAGNAAILTLAAPGETGSLGDNAELVIDGVAPTTSGVASTTADGSYGIDAVIDITVGFTEAVVVDTTGGKPTLQLETGSTDRYASYSSGTGSSTLTFQYTVQDGDTSADLDQPPCMHSTSKAALSQMPLAIQPSLLSLIQGKPVPLPPIAIW